MKPFIQWVVYGVLLLSQLAGLLLFAKGFFPSKVVLPGDGLYYDDQQFEPQFDKLILMVVDAMRSDFIFSNDSSMAFVHQLINNGDALGFTAHSTPPTVTLPRLKGITTGSTPNFLDAILNVAEEDTSSTLGEQDSWVKQLNKQGKKIHMFGDDTWIKLFPNMFSKTEGTNSFFVSDFTDVDNNVTRHIDAELINSDWDCLILHYLGLDHIGHKGGPNSVFMKPKQTEMDSIIKRLYQYTQDSNTLLVVMGDHGMNEIGNHGGSSQGETSAGLLFVSPKFQSITKNQYSSPLPKNDAFDFYRRIQQIDLVPTLAGLLNFPIPKNNLGIFIQELLPLWNDEETQKRVLLQNCNQLKSLVEASFGSALNATKFLGQSFDFIKLSSAWNNVTESIGQHDIVIENSYSFLSEAQSHLASSATNYNYDDIYFGFIILTTSAIATIIAFGSFISNQISLGIIFSAFTLVYSISFHGSSLIEEEYQIWWWLSTALLSIFFYSNKSFSRKHKLNFLIVASGIRIVRSFNNSGQKYITVCLYDVLSEHYNLLWALNALTYGVYAFSIVTGGLSYVNPLLSFIGPFVVVSMSFVFKLCQAVANGNNIPPTLVPLVNWVLKSLGVKTVEDSLIQLAILVFQLIFGLFVLRFLLAIYNFNITTKVTRKFKIFSDLTNIISIFLINQTSAANIPIFLVFFIIRDRFAVLVEEYLAETKSLDRAVVIISIFTMVLQQLSFFSLGNTNSLASVDLSNAYNGISSYDIISVGILTFVSNFSGPIFWAVSSLALLFENGLTVGYLKNDMLWLKSMCSLTFYSVSAVSLVGSCINLRFHLFIWSVFCPKLLYFYSWTFLVNGLVDLLCILMAFIY